MSESCSLQVNGLHIGTLKVDDWRVGPGEIVCLSGASGSGKTRFLRAIADLEPFQGSVRLGSVQSTELAGHQWRSRVMLVPAESLWWANTVGEHFPPDAGDPPEALGLSREVLDWDVSRLSSGEKQRLALWRALSRHPDALLLDEPTANLDEASTQAIERWLQDTIVARAMPTVWVTHDDAQASRVAQRRCSVSNGALQEVT